MAYTTIDDPSLYFQIALYTGNGNQGKEITLGSANFTGEYVGQAIQPDWIWGKCTNLSQNHNLFDTSRGLNKRLTSDQSDAENTDSTTITAVASNSFTLGSSTNLNNADDDFVAWLWKANGGSRTTFTESGNNPGGGYQANTTAGFSIIDYTGTGSAGTVSHGLGATPHWIIVKRRNASSSWIVYHHKNTSAPETDILELQATNATYDNSTYWNDTAPTSSVFTVNTSSDGNADGATYIAYVFTEIQGYSKFGGYTGNGNADGPFVYLGFKPSWLMTKRTDSTDHWRIVDNKREPFNDGSMQGLKANANDTHSDSGSRGLDFLSNGFKVRTTDVDSNASGGDYIYMAFAEHPFVSSEGAPITAR